MQTPKWKHQYYYRHNGTTSLASEVLIPFFLPYFPVNPTVSCWSYWGILLYFILLYQIEMTQPSYDYPGRYNYDTKYIPDVYLRGNELVVVLLATYFPVYRPAAFI